jgi:tetratricopeptide (TPR) repeat protein
MSNNNFVELLTGVLPRKDISKVLPSLRLNSFIWESFENKEFTDALINWDGSDQIGFWIPSNLAIIEILRKERFTIKNGTALNAIIESDPEKLQEILNNQIKEPRIPENLLDVAYYAIGLVQKYQQMSSWQMIFKEIFSQTIYSENTFIKIWGPVIICLYGMVDDFSTITNIVFNHFPFYGTFILLHKTLISNQVSEITSCNYLSSLIKDLSILDQYRTIRLLSFWGYKESTHTLSRIITNNIGSDNPNMGFSSSNITEISENYGSPLWNLINLTSWVLNPKESFDGSQEICEISENLRNHELLRQKYIHDGTIRTESHSISQRSYPENNISESENCEGNIPIIQSNFHHIKNCDSSIIPFRKILEAEKLSFEGNINDGQLLAKKTVGKFVNQSNELFLEQMDDSIFEIDLIKPLRSLINLNLIEQASLLANFLIEIFPNNQELLLEASYIYDLLKMPELAQEYAILGAYSVPGSYKGNRYLAEFYEKKGIWKKSLLERTYIVENDTDYSLDDLLAMANSALANKEFDLVIEISKRAFDTLPNNGFSYWLIGEALTAKGDYDLAIPYLCRSTILIESDERPWKSLINAYRFTNNQQLLLKTIMTATKLIPNSCSLKLSQAKYYIDNEYFEDGQLLLEVVRGLKPKEPSIVMELGRLFEEIGDLDEAKEVYIDALNYWPLISEFTSRLGKLLLDQGKNDEAEVYLKDFITNNPNDFNTLSLYLQSILGDINASILENVFNPSESALSLTQKIQTVCTTILKSRPDDPLFNILMAEILLIQSRSEDALDIYRKLNQFQYRLSMQELYRMKAGYGKAELDCSNPETAIAILKEVVTERPNYFGATRILADAYIKAGLTEMAVKLGLNFIERNNENPKVFDWYFEMIKKIPDKKLGANYINEAIKLVRTNPDVYLSLARMHLDNDLFEEAQYVLVNYLNEDELSINQLQNAAFLFYTLDKLDYSWQLINHGLQNNIDNNIDILSDAAGILIVKGDYSEGIKFLDEILTNRQNEICVLTLKSDLLAESGDLLGAIDQVTTAFNLLKIKINNVADFSDGQYFRYLTPEWNRSLENISDIFMRIIFLNRQLGNLKKAFDFAKESIELIPNHLPTRYRAIELAFEILDFQQALEWASFVDDYRDPEIVDECHESLEEYLESLVGIYCFLCEFEYASGQFSKAKHWFNKLISIDQMDSRIQTLLLRFKIRDGERIRANNEFQSILEGNQDFDYSLQGNRIISNKFETYKNNYQIHLLIDAALELYQWDMAYQLAKMDLEKTPNSPLRHYYLLKVIAHSLEKQTLCNDLQSKNRMDFFEIFRENYLAEANSSIDFIENNSKLPGNSLEYLRIILDHLVKPKGEIAKSIQNLKMVNEDVLLSGIYRKSGNDETLSKLANVQEPHIDVLINAAFGIFRTNLEAGYQLAKNCITNDPDNPFAQVVFSKICEQKGNYKEAYESIKIALINFPEEPNWHLNAARLAEKINKNSESIYHYQKSLNYLPDNISIYLNLGQAYLETNQPRLAIEVFEKCDDEININYQLSLGFAKAYAQLGNYDRANMYIKKSIDAAPNYYEPLLIGAMIAFDSGNILEAGELAERMYNEYPDNIEIILAYSKLEEKLGFSEKAVKALFEAMNRFEYTPLEVVLKCGELVCRMEGSNRAIEILGTKKDRFNTNPEFLSAYSKYHFESGFIQQAELYAYDALKLNPYLPGINKLLADIQKQYGYEDKIEYFLGEEIKNNPKNCLNSYLDLANILYHKKEFTQAIKVYQRAMDFFPDEYLPYYQIAIIFKEFKDYSAAQRMLTKAVELAPEYIQIRRELAAITALNFVHNSQEVNYINDL